MYLTEEYKRDSDEEVVGILGDETSKLWNAPVQMISTICCWSFVLDSLQKVRIIDNDHQIVKVSMIQANRLEWQTRSI